MNRLESENQRLNSSVSELGERVNGLRATEKKLERINEYRGASIDELKKQLEDDRRNLEIKEKTIEMEILSNLTEIVYSVNQDGNDILDETEVEMFIKRIESMNGVDLHDEKLKEIIRRRGNKIDGKYSLLRKEQ